MNRRGFLGVVAGFLAVGATGKRVCRNVSLAEPGAVVVREAIQTIGYCHVTEIGGHAYVAGAEVRPAVLCWVTERNG